jgi:hypothetical protein
VDKDAEANWFPHPRLRLQRERFAMFSKTAVSFFCVRKAI